ncbi:neutral amino acid transporter 9-like isoform X1 [Petromyzon marinus]|uniref:neutral amino acid transporter 9-like isoform X1 n=2 Tax=Petromyzon marinus TaxID=7757 RepID=UPI003F70BC98
MGSTRRETDPLLGGVLPMQGRRGMSPSVNDTKLRRPFYVDAQSIVERDAESGEERLATVSPAASLLSSRLRYYSRLSSSNLTTLQAPHHVIPAPDEIYVYSPLGTAFRVKDTPDGAKQPSLVTIFAIWNTMMGTSILSIPWAMMQAGFTLGIIIIFLMGLITLYSCYRILQSPKAIDGGEDMDFPQVCGHYFGRLGQWISLLFSLVSLAGALIVYWVLMSNFMYNTGRFIYDKACGINMTDNIPRTNGSHPVLCPNPVKQLSNVTGYGGLLMLAPGVFEGPPEAGLRGPTNGSFETFNTFWSQTNTVPLYLVPLLLPLLNFRSAAFFARFNNLGTVSVVYLLILVTVKASQWGIHLDFHWISTSDRHFVPEFRQFFPAMTGILTLAFFLHNCVITLVKNNRHPENNVRDLSIAYGLVGFTYLYVGILVFASFPSPPLWKSCIQENFLDNLPNDDIMALLARVFLLFQMSTVFPMLAYIFRVQIFTQIWGKSYPSVLHVLVLNMVLIGCGVLVARFYPNIGAIIRYSGATCGLAFVFVLPSLVHLLSEKRRGTLGRWSTLAHVALMLCGTANLIAQFFV